MNTEELKASELILDMGVAVPIRPLRFFDRKKEPRKIVIRRPYMGGLIRMCRQFLQIGITCEEMKEYTADQNIEFVARHGKAVSLIVAGAIARGYFTYRLFGPLVAWWLRWRVHPVFLSEAMFQLMQNADIGPFKNTIKLVQSLNVMKPRLSRQSGS
ncbi:MAG: hypothetical protein LBN11_07600 [Tannerella sp.]|jgi:hypothetical protein|nr:hypothetical protein [Tannerella sp.]